ncbi:hypothetical protein GC177_03425 [bacterium]|nr:hypothetical protein [bacterium]
MVNNTSPIADTLSSAFLEVLSHCPTEQSRQILNIVFEAIGEAAGTGQPCGLVTAIPALMQWVQTGADKPGSQPPMDASVRQELEMNFRMPPEIAFSLLGNTSNVEFLIGNNQYMETVLVDQGQAYLVSQDGQSIEPIHDLVAYTRKFGKDCQTASQTNEQFDSLLQPFREDRINHPPKPPSLSSKLQRLLADMDVEPEAEAEATATDHDTSEKKERQRITGKQLIEGFSVGVSALQTGLQGTTKALAALEQAKGAKGLHAVAAGLTALTAALGTFVAVAKILSPEEEKQKPQNKPEDAKPQEAKVTPEMPELEIIKGATKDLEKGLGKAA